MKSDTLFWTCVAAIVALALHHNEEQQADDVGEGAACTKQIEQLQEALFPKNSWIETEAWFLAVGQMVGAKLPGLEARVANYEVGRATALQFALSRAKGSSACRG